MFSYHGLKYIFKNNVDVSSSLNRFKSVNRRSIIKRWATVWFLRLVISSRHLAPICRKIFAYFCKGNKKKTNKVPIFTARMSTGRTKHHHVGNLIGDNYFNCRFNLIQLQSWLKAPLRSRSHMTSHITSGKSREKICISRQLNFFAFKLTI